MQVSNITLTQNASRSLIYTCNDLAGLISQTAKLVAQGVPSCRSFSFEELKEATEGFHASRFLGEGSLGKVCFI